MPGASRLGIYNGALRVCGERRLATLNENREPRRLLDDVWTGGGLDRCLEAGQWNFAMRSVQIDYDPAEDPQFGLAYAFTKPDDWIRTCGFCSDERFEVPYRAYKDEVGFWYADITPIYVRYVSNDAAFGGDLTKYPGTYQEFVECWFARQIIRKLTSDKEKVAEVKKELKDARRDALAKDAMNDSTQIPFRGSWTRSRSGGRTPWRDGGNRGSLIG